MASLIDNSGVVQDINGKSVVELNYQVPPEYYHILMLPQSAKRKDRIEAIGGLFAEMAIEEPLNHNHAMIIRSLGRFMGYMLNCNSWQDNSMQEYDRKELLKRVKQLESFYYEQVKNI